ncbi:hypothetical protein L5B88_09600 [Pseudomonas aeruginosa]|nr:hypothetical protein [Pseudomonas aeruginosa]
MIQITARNLDLGTPARTAIKQLCSRKKMDYSSIIASLGDKTFKTERQANVPQGTGISKMLLLPMLRDAGSMPCKRRHRETGVRQRCHLPMHAHPELGATVDSACRQSVQSADSVGYSST